MDCTRFRDLVDLHAAGELEEMLAEECTMHAQRCTDCRGLLAEAHAAAARLGDALGAMEPGKAFDERVHERLEAGEDGTAVRRRPRAARRWPGRRAWYAAAAAAAIVLGTVLAFPRGTAARIASGGLVGGADRIRPHMRYTTVAETSLVFAGDTRALLTEQSSFEIEDSHLRLHDGRCYVAAREDAGEVDLVARVSGGGMSAELGGGAEVFFYSGRREGRGLPAPVGVADAVLGMLMSEARADEASDGAALLLVFRGSAKVRLDTGEIAVVAGQGFFADRADEGPFDIEEMMKRYETEIAAASRALAELTEKTRRYERIVADYTRTLQARSARRDELRAAAARSTREDAELAELEKRIDIVTRAREAHERPLAEWGPLVAQEREARIDEPTRRLELITTATVQYRAAMNTLKR